MSPGAPQGRLLGFLHLLHQALGQEGLREAPRGLRVRDLQSLQRRSVPWRRVAGRYARGQREGPWG